MVQEVNEILNTMTYTTWQFNMECYATVEGICGIFSFLFSTSEILPCEMGFINHPVYTSMGLCYPRYESSEPSSQEPNLLWHQTTSFLGNYSILQTNIWIRNDFCPEKSYKFKPQSYLKHLRTIIESLGILHARYTPF